jgi:hypothetical protein
MQPKETTIGKFKGKGKLWVIKEMNSHPMNDDYKFYMRIGTTGRRTEIDETLYNELICHNTKYE